MALDAERDATSDGPSACSGKTPTTEQISDRTADVAHGVNVKIHVVTSDTGGDTFEHYDVPLYSALADKIFYFSIKSLELIEANPDGTDPEIIATRHDGRYIQPQMSFDGRFVAFRFPNGGGQGTDIYGFRIDASGICTLERITHQNTPYPSGAGEPTDELVSPPAFDPKYGAYAIAYSPDRYEVDVVYDDGKGPSVANGGVQAGPSKITLNAVATAAGLHRLRMSPKFINLIMYKPETGPPTNYVTDYQAASPTTYTWGTGGHQGWAPDGVTAGLIATQPQWQEWKVADPSGHISAGYPRQLDTIKPHVTTSIFYTAYSPDMKLLALVTDPANDPTATGCGGSTGLGGRLYLVNRSTNNTVFLSNACAAEKPYLGQPRINFVGTSSTIALQSLEGLTASQAGNPRIHLVTGYALP